MLWDFVLGFAIVSETPSFPIQQQFCTDGHVSDSAAGGGGHGEYPLRCYWELRGDRAKPSEGVSPGRGRTAEWARFRFMPETSDVELVRTFLHMGQRMDQSVDPNHFPTKTEETP